MRLHYGESWQQVTCDNCKKVYLQLQFDQVAGCRDKESDVCPYCRHINGYSMEVDFMNKKLED